MTSQTGSGDGYFFKILPRPLDVFGEELLYLLHEQNTRVEAAVSASMIGQHDPAALSSLGGHCSSSKRPPVSWITSHFS